MQKQITRIPVRQQDKPAPTASAKGAGNTSELAARGPVKATPTPVSEMDRLMGMWNNL